MFSNIRLPSNQELQMIDLVSQNGLLLCNMEKKWQENENIATTAVQQNGLVYFWLSPLLKKNKTIKRLAEANFPKKFSGSLNSIRSGLGKRIFFLPPHQADCLALLNAELSFLQEQGAPNQKIYVNLEKLNNNCSFLRDSRICLDNGEQLIPYSPKDFNSWLKLGTKHRITLPFGYKQTLLEGPLGYFGFGFHRSNTRKAIMTSCELRLPYTLANTMIEGGNCFLFKDQGINKAIIGEWSLYLSYYALKEQGFFKNLSYLQFETNIPSQEAILFARNLDHYKSLMCNLVEYQKEKKEVEGFYENKTINTEAKEAILAVLHKESLQRITFLEEQIRSPISEEDKMLYRERAKKIDYCLEYTKQKMAEELHTAIENLIFIPQTDFHIDMRMWIMDEKVILHDSLKALKFLQQINFSSLPENTQRFINGYLKTAQLHVNLFKDVEDLQEKILKDRGLQVYKLPAVFSFPGVSELNYCNGITLSKEQTRGFDYRNVFITTGSSFPEETIVHETFKALFNSTFPETEFREIPYMSKFIAETGGGLHCLTFDF